MRILTRDEGVQFLLQPYRERLRVKSATLLKREVFLLAQNYGAYSRIYKQPDGFYEAVFSHDPGYLLGETVWRHFGKPENLLYCEAINENQVLVVVVRNNNVYLDTQIAKQDIKEELSFLHGDEDKYAVYIYGDVPIEEEENPDQLVLDKKQIKLFSRLQGPVFSSLPVQKELALVPVEIAVAELKLNRRANITAISIAVIVFAGILWAWLGSQPTAKMEEVVNPYFRYVVALRTPDSGEQLTAIAQQIILMHSNAVPGWVPLAANYAGGQVRFDMRSFGGSMTALHKWATAHGGAVTMISNNVIVSLPINVKGRLNAPALANSQTILAQLTDHMLKVLPDKTVSVTNSTNRVSYIETPVILNVTNLSPEILKLVGRELSGMPLNLTKCQFVLSKGVLTGTVQLNLLGS